MTKAPGSRAAWRGKARPDGIFWILAGIWLLATLIVWGISLWRTQGSPDFLTNEPIRMVVESLFLAFSAVASGTLWYVALQYGGGPFSLLCAAAAVRTMAERLSTTWMLAPSLLKQGEWVSIVRYVTNVLVSQAIIGLVVFWLAKLAARCTGRPVLRAVILTALIGVVPVLWLGIPWLIHGAAGDFLFLIIYWLQMEKIVLFYGLVCLLLSVMGGWLERRQRSAVLKIEGLETAAQIEETGVEENHE